MRLFIVWHDIPELFIPTEWGSAFMNGELRAAFKQIYKFRIILASTLERT